MPPSASSSGTFQLTPPHTGAAHDIQRVLDALPGDTQITITISFMHRTAARSTPDIAPAMAGPRSPTGGAALTSSAMPGDGSAVAPASTPLRGSTDALPPIAAVERARWTDDRPRMIRDWAPLLGGISARELGRAVRTGALSYTTRASSRGHRGKLVRPVDLLAYLRQREAVLQGSEAAPSWFSTVVQAGF